MEQPLFVYTTYPSLVEAEQAGRNLVESGLAACVNILPEMISIYRWKGAVERADEVVMIIKTRAALQDRVAAAVRQQHSYETPAIIFLPTGGGDQPYVRWIFDETAAPNPSPRSAR